MSKLSKEQKRALISEYSIKTADDINDMLKDLFSDVIHEVLEAELDSELGYPKNGSTKRTLATRTATSISDNSNLFYSQ